jgi:hypothetical protein
MASDYKAEEDVARVFHLMSSAHLMRDYPQTSALAASFLRELASMNARQAERDQAKKENPQSPLKRGAA